jgi:hypothetical protein
MGVFIEVLGVLGATGMLTVEARPVAEKTRTEIFRPIYSYASVASGFRIADAGKFREGLAF